MGVERRQWGLADNTAGVLEQPGNYLCRAFCACMMLFPPVLHCALAVRVLLVGCQVLRVLLIMDPALLLWSVQLFGNA